MDETEDRDQNARSASAGGVLKPQASLRLEELIGDSVRMWAELGGPIMLKAVEGTDPVELTEDHAELVAGALLDLVRQIREADGD